MSTKNLGGKSSLNESVVVAAENESLKKFCEESRKLIPIDSEEKAKKYRELCFLHYRELDDAKKMK